MTKTVLETLEAARKLIEKPESWTKGQYAKDAEGLPVDFNSSTAVCWCSSGALHAAAGLGDGAREARMVIGDALGRSLIGFNDAPERTHAEVLAAFDAAIAKEKETQHV